MKTNLLKKITLNTLIIMNIGKKRNLNLKSIVGGAEIEPFNMNEEKARQLWKIIQEAGDYLMC